MIKKHFPERIIAGRNLRSERYPPRSDVKKVVPKLETKAGAVELIETKKPDPLPFQEEPIPGAEITVGVCQGLGDIFWVYQKLAPYYQSINFVIYVLKKEQIQERSLPWMRLFPKVKTATIKVVEQPVYARLAACYSNMAEIWKANAGQLVEYSCNRWLETGTRLDEIDPGSRVEWSVPLREEPSNLPFKEYATLYVSGSSINPNVLADPKLQAWPVEKWAEFVVQLRQKYHFSFPMVILGAEFDRFVAEETSKLLNSFGIQTHLFIQQKPEMVVHTIKNSRFFLGYQSGLNVLADNLSVPQVMMYFVFLKPMMYTWCQPGNAHSKFLAETFDVQPKALVDKLEVSSWME